ncbi:hypothetical protein JAAARDRAFT_197467 [Jaapia argillacea MUCL 33604]|uniref:F-box domain-containing protein n=1 Tax=Jaapia argillacea MUCL 33604 TaxID=933084 RepID=A0A067PSK1_9AGAM|nr:hypothetical protein JAAARDRAFT_197467 [Jaapia argillacea MUCL 33604]
MHRALKLYEILSLVCEQLRRGSSRRKKWEGYLFSFALTCEAFSEVALDFLWSEVHDFKRLLSLLPLDEDVATSGLMLGSPSQKDWERFRLYSKRLQTLSINTFIDSQLLRRIEGDSSRDAPFAFPRLSTLNVTFLFPPTSDATLHLLAFLRPTIINLSIHGYKSSISTVGAALRCALPSIPLLTSLQIAVSDQSATATEIRGIQHPLLEVIHIPVHLERICLPVSLLSAQTISALASLPNLKTLVAEDNVDGGMFSMFSNWPSEGPNWDINEEEAFDPSDWHPSDFPSLQRIEADVGLCSLTRLLNLHPAFARVPQFSFPCYLPGPTILRDELLASSLPQLRSPTHLDIDLASGDLSWGDTPLRSKFFAPLVSAWSDLVALSINHAAPLDVDDDDLAAIVSQAPKLELVRLAPSPLDHSGPSRPFQLRASLACLQSFAKHCPNIRELAIPVNVWTVPPPEYVAVSLRGPLLLDMSVSPVTKRTDTIARFLAKLFPHPHNRLTCHWSPAVWNWDDDWNETEESDFEENCGSHLDESLEKEDEISYPETFLRRWRRIGHLAHRDRRAAGTL